MTTTSETIGKLDTLRRLCGPNSPEGWECSNAIEMLKSRAKAENPAQIACLNANLQRTTERLADLMTEHRNRQAGEG